VVIVAVMNNAYNNYSEARILPKKIVDYLFNNVPGLWKLLYYDVDPDSKKDLTNTQKAKMICKSSAGDTSKFNILFQHYNNEALTDATTQIRIEIMKIDSLNRTDAEVRVLFQVIVNNKLMVVNTNVSNVDNRAMAITQTLVEALNGTRLDGTKTPLNIDYSNDRLTGVTSVYFNTEFSGYEIIMSCIV
jgi:hypothetical protein